jgi:hypothetical protein
MRILILKNAEWNDSTYANNLLTNWFEGSDAEFANIYCGPGLPFNSVCCKYYRITDRELLRSFVGGRKAGSIVEIPKTQDEINEAKIQTNQKGIYRIFKK